jgi:hypothetical protein
MLRPPPFRLGLIAVVAVALTVSISGSEVDRLLTLARVWAAVKYLHPFILQKQIDWDAALIRTVPKVRAAANDEAFAEAIGSMLKELGDPATRVIQKTASSRRATGIDLTRWAGDVLVINAGPFAEANTGMALYGELSTLATEMKKAKQVVIDVRNHSDDADERSAVAFVVSELRALISEPVTGPASIYVYHSGYRPQDGTTSGGYFSGLLTVAGAAFAPVAGAVVPTRIVFVTDADSALPSIAVALQAAGKAVIVSGAPLGDDVSGDTKTLALGTGWRAQIRLQTMGTKVVADVIAPDPMADALAIASGKKAVPSFGREAIAATVAEPRWRPDPDYKDMAYPDLAHREVGIRHVLSRPRASRVGGDSHLERHRVLLSLQIAD